MWTLPDEGVAEESVVGGEGGFVPGEGQCEYGERKGQKGRKGQKVEGTVTRAGRVVGWVIVKMTKRTGSEVGNTV